MQKNHSFRSTIFTLLLTLPLAYALTGCTSTSSTTSSISNIQHYGGVVETKAKETETSPEVNYNGTCYGVVTAIDTQNLTITIQNINDGSIRLYTYTGGTDVRDKYGDIISMTQINLGDIVIGGYDEGNSKMKKLTKSADAWENRNVTDFKIDNEAGTIKIGTTLYQFKENVVVLSDGQRLETATEIHEKDELTLKGCDKTIYSITITKGHGYVILENAEDYYGGIVMIGNRIGQQVSEGMILVVPEGEYNLHITKERHSASKSIKVVKNQELVVDVGQFKEEAQQIGSIEFTIKPENAVLYIDGRKTAHNEVAELLYGSYKIRIEAEGYITYKADLLVNESFQKREITLGKPEQIETPSSEALETVIASTSAAAQGETTAPATTSSSAATGPTVQTPTVTEPTITHPTVTSPQQPSTQQETTAPGPGANTGNEIADYKVHIEAPVGVSVYFDGVYQGIAPVSFTKQSGEHTIILKQEGYATKAHTVTISSDKADSHYSFPALVPNQ